MRRKRGGTNLQNLEDYLLFDVKPFSNPDRRNLIVSNEVVESG